MAGRRGIPNAERNIKLYDVINADEAFFTSTAFCLLFCTKINGLTIGDGKTGPVSKRLLTAWSEDVGVDILAQTKAFAAEVGGMLSSGTSIYRFDKGTR